MKYTLQSQVNLPELSFKIYLSGKKSWHRELEEKLRGMEMNGIKLTVAEAIIVSLNKYCHRKYKKGGGFKLKEVMEERRLQIQEAKILTATKKGLAGYECNTSQGPTYHWGKGYVSYGTAAISLLLEHFGIEDGERWASVL